MSHAAALWVSLMLLLANAFFVGAEFAAMTARRSTLEPLADGGSARARMSLDALEHMGAMLVTAQLGITVCSVGLGALAETALDEDRSVPSRPRCRSARSAQGPCRLAWPCSSWSTCTSLWGR